MKIFLLVACLLSRPILATCLPSAASVPGTEVYIISSKADAVMNREFTARFGLRGMGVVPVGVIVENIRHYHLSIGPT